MVFCGIVTIRSTIIHLLHNEVDVGVFDCESFNSIWLRQKLSSKLLARNVGTQLKVSPEVVL